MLSRQELNMMPEIHASIYRGQFHDLRLLISNGENVNRRDHEKRTPLIVCTLIEKETWAVGIARMLLEQGAMVGYKDKLDRNALMHACLKARSELVSVFLNAIDYDLNQKDRHGNTALFYAASSGHEGIVREMVQTLLRYNLETDLPNKWDMTPLLEACRLGHKSCAQVLVDEGGASKAHRDDIRKWNAEEWMEEYDKNNVETGVVRCRAYDKPWLQKAEGNQPTNNSSDGKRVMSASSASASEKKTPRLTRSYSDPIEPKLEQAYKTKMTLVNRSWTDRKSDAIKANFYPSPAPFSNNYYLDESRPSTGQPWKFTPKSRHGRSSHIGDNEDQWSEEFKHLYRRFEIEVTRSYRRKAKAPVQPVSNLPNPVIVQPSNLRNKNQHHQNGHMGHHELTHSQSDISHLHRSIDSDGTGRNSSRLLQRRPSELGKRFPIGVAGSGSDTSSDRDACATKKKAGDAMAPNLTGTSLGKQDDKSSTSSGDSVGRMVLKAFRRRNSSRSINVTDSLKPL